MACNLRLSKRGAFMNPEIQERPCALKETSCPRKKIVVTGGPGAGKTAILELARRQFCHNVLIIPEAASIVFGGGFLRRDSMPARRAAQRAIYYIQREYERAVEEEGLAPILLCDRGTVDGVAYWPASAEDYYGELQTTQAIEYSRYDSVIHLRTPSLAEGFNHQNPLRLETAQQAAAIDQRILDAWAGHPQRIVIESSREFLSKANQTLASILRLLPPCCQELGNGFGQSAK